MRRGKHIIDIEKGGQARILFLECGLVRLFDGLVKSEAIIAKL